jgi:hypothetical protein
MNAIKNTKLFQKFMQNKSGLINNNNNLALNNNNKSISSSNPKTVIVE